MKNKNMIIGLVLGLMLVGMAGASNTITNFTIVGLPKGIPWSITIPSYTTNTFGSTNSITINSTSNIISFSNLPQPLLPNTVAFTFLPLSPIYRGTTYLFNSLPVFLAYNGNTNIFFHTLFNFTAFNSSLSNTLKINLNKSPSSILAAFAANGITIGTNALADKIILNNQTRYLPYGLLKNKSVYVAASGNIKTSSFNNSNNTLNFITTNVIKNQSYICLNLTSSLGYSQSLCKAGIYHFDIPELFNHFGLRFNDSATSVVITAKLQATLIGGETMPFNALIKVGNNIVYSTSNLNTNSFSITNTFTLNIGENMNVTLDGLGNSNYTLEDPSLITPASVVKIVNVSINNQQSSPITAGTQVIIPFNGLNYSSQFNGNLINLEVFNGLTGNVLYSMFMGSQTQANQLAGFNTVGTGASNDILMASLSSSIRANANAVNVISIGFTSMTTNALNGNNMGLRPDLWCASGCPQTYYAQYDDGLNVFNTVYTNFANTICPSQFTCQSSTINNGITFFKSNTLQSTGTFNSEYYTLEGMGNFIKPDGYQQFGWFDVPSGAENGIIGCSGQTCSAGTGNYNIGEVGVSPTDMLVRTSNQEHVMSVWTIPKGTTGSLDYNANVVGTGFGSTSMSIRLTFAGVVQTNAFFQYLYLRQTPPNGVAPAITFGPVQSTAAVSATPNIILSNTMIDQGQSILFTANVIGGSAPYSYAYNVYATNSGSITLIANQLYQNNAIPSNTFFWTPNPNLYLANTLFFANVVVISGSGTVNSIANSFGYNSALVAGTPTETNSIIDIGQFTLQTAQASGGTTPYTTYQWFTKTGAAPTCAVANIINGATSSTYIASPTTTNSYAYNVVDSTTTANGVCSTADTTTVYSDPIATLTFSNTILDSGQTTNALISITGGIGPFTANLVNTTGAGWITPKANVIITGNSGATNVISFVVSSKTASNSFTMNYLFTDYGTSTNGLFNSVAQTFSVNAMPTLTITPSCGLCSTASTEVYTFNIIGGTGPFQGTLASGPLIGLTPSGNIIIFNTVLTTNTQSFLTQTVGQFQYNAVIIDYGTTTNVLFNSILSAITVTAQTSSGGGGAGGGPSPTTCPPNLPYNAITGTCGVKVPVVNLPPPIQNKSVSCPLNQLSNSSLFISVLTQCGNLAKIVFLHTNVTPFALIPNYNVVLANQQVSIAKAILQFSFTPAWAFLFIMVVIGITVYFGIEAKKHKFITSATYSFLFLAIMLVGLSYFI